MRVGDVNWCISRVITPGGLCGYRDEGGLKIIDFGVDGRVQLFRSGKDSQGLISLKNRVVGASVTSDIKTENKRKDERKTTFIQYDKNSVDQKGADFTVNPENHLGWTNYQGGHLIDYKYSVEDSHYKEENYIPAHYFYNSPIKEYLVNHCHSYVEIPIYTPQPPKIGVKRGGRQYHSIPIGIILVQITGDKIQDAYYFPNNDFDYQALKKNLKVTKDIAATITPYFKLEKCFHQILRPAIITGIQARAKEQAEQFDREKGFFELMEDISFGMSLTEYGEDQDIISQLSFSVLSESGVDPFLCLDCTTEEFAQLENQPLQKPFNALGKYLIFYGIRNALKTEVLSIKSRLIFLNVILDFIESEDYLSEEASDFFDDLASQFKPILKELGKIVETMTLEELMYLANTYQRLSSQFNHPISLEDDKIYDSWGLDDLCEYFRESIKTLKEIKSKYPESFRSWFFVHFIIDAKDAMAYFIKSGEFEEKDFVEERKLLKSVSIPVSEFLRKQHFPNKEANFEFQTNINHSTHVKANSDYLKSIFR
jgi:hypothetical protein